MKKPITLDTFFEGRASSRRIFDALRKAVESLGPCQMRVSKSQVAFRRKRNFAMAWTPDQYLGAGHAPLVLTVSFDQRDRSPRWKEVVQPAPNRFTHHLELWSAKDVDSEVRDWLRLAWEQAA